MAKATPGESQTGTTATATATGLPRGAPALRSLNKVAWDEKDGKRLAVGGLSGVVTAYEVGSELAGDGARPEDWADMRKLVGRMERRLW